MGKSLFQRGGRLKRERLPLAINKPGAVAAHCSTCEKSKHYHRADKMGKNEVSLYSILENLMFVIISKVMFLATLSNHFPAIFLKSMTNYVK